MNSRFTFVLGCVVGIGLALLTGRLLNLLLVKSHDSRTEISEDSGGSSQDPKTLLAMASDRIDRLEVEKLALANRVQELLHKNADLDAASSRTGGSRSFVNSFSGIVGGVVDGTNEDSGSMQALMKSSLDQQLATRIAQLKFRLNLGEDQERMIRQLLEKANQQTLDRKSTRLNSSH